MMTRSLDSLWSPIKATPSSGMPRDWIASMDSSVWLMVPSAVRLHRIKGSEKAEYFVVVPANPVDTGDAEKEGAAFVWEATTRAAEERLEQTLSTLQARGLTVRGELGDYRPLLALDNAVREFGPDHVVISTHPEERSTWLHHGVVDEARKRYDDIDIEHVVVEPVQAS